MSEKARQIAERVADRMSSSQLDSVSSLQNIINSLSQRVYDLESQINPSTQNLKPKIQNFAYSPSQEKFNIAEAVVEELVEFVEQEKACMFEPNKSCDKCSMCSSRGF